MSDTHHFSSKFPTLSDYSELDDDLIKQLFTYFNLSLTDQHSQYKFISYITKLQEDTNQQLDLFAYLWINYKNSIKHHIADESAIKHLFNTINVPLTKTDSSVLVSIFSTEKQQKSNEYIHIIVDILKKNEALHPLINVFFNSLFKKTIPSQQPTWLKKITLFLKNSIANVLHARYTLIIISLYLGLNAFLFYLANANTSNETVNLYSQIADGSAALIPLNVCLLLLLMLKHISRWFRAIHIKQFKSFDTFKLIHQIIAYSLLILSLVHIVMMLLYYTTLNAPFKSLLLADQPDMIRAMNTSMYEYVSEDESIDLFHQWIKTGHDKQQFNDEIYPLLKEDCNNCHSRSSTMSDGIPSIPFSNYDDVMIYSKSGEYWSDLSVRATVHLSGFFLILIFLVMAFFALPVNRKKKYLSFALTHKLYILWVILLLIHAPSAWEWILIPLVLYAVEKIAYYKKSYCINEGQVKHFEADILQLTLPRPKHFKFLAGESVYLRIPQICKREWHPFTISSAPHEANTMTCHIKKSGDWTEQLFHLTATESPQDTSLEQVEFYGPCATPSMRLIEKERLILVAAGIGITPFMSFLNHVKTHYAENRHHELRAQKIKLIWVSRGLDSFSHYLETLKQLKSLDNDNNISIELYITGIKNTYQRALIEFFSAYYYQQRQVNIFSKSAIKIHVDRPQWEHVLQQESTIQSEPWSVFYCGPKAISKQLKQITQRMKLCFSYERF